MTIRRLPQDVAAKIAAGEVVERPAAVVKELVENAIDADARQIRVDLMGGGLDLIRVTDDGAGLAREDLPLAFARHATSKIGALDDLERITTLGFRGEALASVAAVSSVTLVSRPAEAEMGAQIMVNEGAASEVTATGAARGTSIAVRGLFASVPARLKFLKTRATETGRCMQLVEQYALAYPEIRFVVTSEGRQALLTAGDGKLRNVIAVVYGLSVAEQMTPLGASGEEEPLGVEAPGERPVVSGYVSKPTCYKATRQYMSFFVNRRWVQSRTLSFAVEEAYHSLLLTGRHPVAVVNISLDPALIDVNVHPAKTEIRFLRERQVYAAVQRATREAVLAGAETPIVSSRGFTVPEWEIRPPSSGQPTSHETAERQANLWQSAAPSSAAGGASADEAADDIPVAISQDAADDEVAVVGRELPVLRVLGQVSQSYIITEGPDGMYLVDQHAAHERILLERMIAALRERAVASQLLLDPLPVELAPAELEIVSEHLEQLRAIGFEIEPFGAESLLVRAVPAALSKAQTGELRELLVALAGADAEAASHGETWEEHALANVACRAAIKAGQALASEEQRELIRQLEGAKARQSCCHGRPTMVRLSFAALEREFDRR
ncbi:MAG TPA: DNA mismatch repair endonuclease MutL [Ktedonobacterales bacterium]|jgi:DNA mismatch repair protein MutL